MNKVKHSKATRLNKFKLLFLNVAILFLVSCTSKHMAKLISVEHQENIEVSKYRSIGTVDVDVLDKTFTNGLAHLEFQLDSDIEKQVIDKKMAFLFAEVSSCVSKVAIYSVPVFENTERVNGNSFSVFLPYDFKKEIFDNDNLIYNNFNPHKKVNFFREGGCVELNAGSMSGRKLQSNSIRIFSFNGDKNSMSWEKGTE